MIIIYTTVKNEREAKILATHLLEKELVACANFFPARGMFRWEGKLNEVDEIVILFKTSVPFETVQKEIASVHPYEEPCIIHWKVEANSSFAAWVETQSGSS